MITTVKARFIFLYVPDDDNHVVIEEIKDEAAEWLCGRVCGFYGWRVKDTFDIIDVYTKNKRNLVEFLAEFATEDFDSVKAYAEQIISFKEEY